ncbi:energy-coupling factor transporter transmembrane component T family protein [Luethyella okanaganae]|uniref:Energy-coupling factor transporter transmembrane component T family protein n=1 Tax=Luethyella okanaganae TaxID=69372 RepID=A0ABW1VDE0_9MICO
MIGLYQPGSSVVHRAPAVVKLLLLSVAIGAAALLQEPWQLAVAVAVVLGLFLVARVPIGPVWRQISPVLWVLLVAVPVQLLLGGWLVATMMAGRLMMAVALAALFTLTTTVSAVLDTCQTLLRPFRRRVDAERVGLLLALTIRCIPLIADIVAEVVEARRARGSHGSVMSLAVPVIVRSLQSAESLGDALIARGFDD